MNENEKQTAIGALTPPNNQKPLEPDQDVANKAMSVTEAIQAGIRKRTPISGNERKLETTAIPGYHLHWPLEQRVPLFLQAGYEFVEATEVVLTQVNIASSAGFGGNSDLGNRIRVFGGSTDHGQALYHVLMKIKEAWWLEDQKKLEEKNGGIIGSIFRADFSQVPSQEVKPNSQVDRGLTYVDKERSLFQRTPRKVT